MATGAAIRTVEEYMQLPYRMEIYWDEDYWAAEFPELPGLVAGADSWDELLATIGRAKEAWFSAMIEDGLPIPEPQQGQSFSGKLQLRLPKSVHRQAAHAAEQEGVSLNTLIVTAVARFLGASETKS